MVGQTFLSVDGLTKIPGLRLLRFDSNPPQKEAPHQ